MEILDYLRIARRRLWILILIPLLAGAAATAYVLMSPQTYSATATLSSTAFVGGASDQFTGTQAASQFAAAFSESAMGPSVLSAASQDTGIAVGALADGLTVTQSGASSNMTLTYTSEGSDDVVKALRSVESQTLQSLFGLQVSLAQSQVDEARSEVAAANVALESAILKYGARVPKTFYQRQLLNVAVMNLTTAQTVFQRATSQLAAAQNEDILYISNISSVSRTDQLVQTVIPVVGAAIFLAVILVMMLELLANARRQAQRPQTEPQRGWAEPQRSQADVR